jgi:hypothetical protein
MHWQAVDGGKWYLRSTPDDEPTGTYTPGCWLPMRGWTADALRVRDDFCRRWGILLY